MLNQIIGCVVWLRINASGSLTIDIFIFSTLIIVSCLHFGQYSAKFTSTVSDRTLILVLLVQIGQRSQHSFSLSTCTTPPQFFALPACLQFVKKFVMRIMSLYFVSRYTL